MKLETDSFTLFVLYVVLLGILIILTLVTGGAAFQMYYTGHYVMAGLFGIIAFIFILFSHGAVVSLKDVKGD